MIRVPSKTACFASALVASVALVAATAPNVDADASPVGPLPPGPVTTTSTKPGLLVAVALPAAPSASGRVWRLARRYDATVIRQVSEADVGSSVVIVFRVVGRGRTTLVFALTRGDASPKALKAQRVQIRAT
jgi:hypothetical protein